MLISLQYIRIFLRNLSLHLSPMCLWMFKLIPKLLYLQIRKWRTHNFFQSHRMIFQVEKSLIRIYFQLWIGFLCLGLAFKIGRQCIKLYKTIPPNIHFLFQENGPTTIKLNLKNYFVVQFQWCSVVICNVRTRIITRVLVHGKWSIHMWNPNNVMLSSLIPV